MKQFGVWKRPGCLGKSNNSRHFAGTFPFKAKRLNVEFIHTITNPDALFARNHSEHFSCIHIIRISQVFKFEEKIPLF